jgi:hypothetical protein
MLFLLNDVVLDLDPPPAAAHEARRFEKLDFDYVLELGCELFAEDPLLHRHDSERARRLAWLIHDRSPEVNAALFAAPAAGCAPELVEPQFCSLPEAVLRQLNARASRGKLDAVSADKAVWGRMAA